MNSSQHLRNCSRDATSQRMLRPGIFARWEERVGRIETGCRDRIRTGDLRGMNPASYLCSTLLRNGWSVTGVSGGRRRSSLTRRGIHGRNHFVYVPRYVTRPYMPLRPIRTKPFDCPLKTTGGYISTVRKPGENLAIRKHNRRNAGYAQAAQSGVSFSQFEEQQF